jgi:cyclophilin family peptidyl-prolyl cis-trans isomerase
MRRWVVVVAIVMTGMAGGASAQTPARGRATAPGPQKTTPAVADAKPSPGAGPIVVFETVKGTFEMETYPNEAPKSVEHILTLVRRNFYNGLRVHRLVKGQLVQFGDPLSRDMSKRDRWGTGGSGKSIGVAEISPKRKHLVGSVALAHPGDPRLADSQLYVMLIPQPKYDKDYTVIGRVIAGMDVVQKLQETDVIRRATIKGSTPARP